jgi:uncharacterized protein YjbJ (UPF0337 family)
MAESTKKKTSDAKAHVKNAAVTTKGKVKAATGKALGNKRLQVKGTLEEMKGKTKQAGQRVKETFED